MYFKLRISLIVNSLLIILFTLSRGLSEGCYVIVTPRWMEAEGLSQVPYYQEGGTQSLGAGSFWGLMGPLIGHSSLQIQGATGQGEEDRDCLEATSVLISSIHP